MSALRKLLGLQALEDKLEVLGRQNQDQELRIKKLERQIKDRAKHLQAPIDAD